MFLFPQSFMKEFDILLVASNSPYCQEAEELFARYNYRLTIAENYRNATGDRASSF